MSTLKSGITAARSLALVTMLAVPLTAISSGSYYGNDYGALTISMYEKGKKVFKDKVTCSNCPHAELELTRENVASILDELDENGEIGETLTQSERMTIKHYINKRFNL